MDQPSSPPPANLLSDVFAGYRTARVIHAAAELGLADHLADGPRSAAELAAATGTNPDALARLLRALTALTVVAAEADGRFALTPLGATLRSDVPGSVRDGIRFVGGEWYWRAWGDLLYSLRTGEPAFHHVWGMSNFDYYELHPEALALHEAFFATLARATSAPIVAAGDFGRFGTVVDVGGNTGSLLAAILAAHPGTRGVLFDLPHVVAAAGDVLAAAGVADRCNVIGGSFFEEIPGGGDAYLLKYIVHDWDDDRAIALLRRCRAAMGRGSTLLVVESVLPEIPEPGLAARQATLTDLAMLVATPGGRERTEMQFRALLARADFDLRVVTPTASPLRILEAAPV